VSAPRRSLVAAGTVCGLLLAASEASAYCRTRTCQLRLNADCPQDEVTGCHTEGEEIYWPDTCMTYAIQRDGSRREAISARELETIVGDGFRAWSDATCAQGGTPPLTALSQGRIACDAVEFNCEDVEANSNLIVFRDNFLDTRSFYFGVLALTTVTANIRTGEIFDADIEINSRDEDFSTELGSNDPNLRDLHAVLNHELGHLLGISHSREPGALMLDNYRGTILPAADDTAALCAARGAQTRDPECDVVELPSDAGCVGSKLDCRTVPTTPAERQPSSGCACRVAAPAPAASAPWWLAALAALGLARRRRR
jgi:MYXO-CTERM domain-containing protein